MAVLSELIEKYTSYDYELTEFTLATGVDRICALRGWVPAQGSPYDDQGLVVAYIKLGSIYYRNYSLQLNGSTYLWNPETLIAELNHGDYTDVALFRTNDFRIGVLAKRSNNEVYYVLTERNYAGMSFYPEIMSASIATKELEWCHIDVPDPIMTAIERIDAHRVWVGFNLPIINTATSVAGFALTSGAALTVQSVEPGGNGNDLIITTTEEVPEMSNIALNYDDWKGNLRSVATPHCRRYIDSFTATAYGGKPSHSASISAELSAEVDFVPLIFSEGYAPSEIITAELSAEVDFVPLTFSEGYQGAEYLTAEMSAEIEFWHIDNAPL